MQEYATKQGARVGALLGRSEGVAYATMFRPVGTGQFCGEKRSPVRREMGIDFSHGETLNELANRRKGLM